MELRMNKELNNIFNTCNERSLSARDTALITLAARLASNQSAKTLKVKDLLKIPDISLEQVHRVACLCACVVGPQIEENYLQALKTARITESTKILKDGRFQSCTQKTLTGKIHHLVSLAACLAGGCICASGHIIEARNAGATAEEIARCACIASCVAGMKIKYDFLSHLQRTANCKSCAC